MGFFIGSVVGYLRNLIVFLSARILHRDAEIHRLRRLLDYI
jgi:hypothetical protein